MSSQRVAAPSPDPTVVRQQVNTYRQAHNAPPVAYDTTLAASAQIAADRLFQSGVYHPKPTATGQNLLVFAGSLGASSTELVERAVDAWYQSGLDYDFATPGVTTIATSQFTQLVWKATRRVGAGVARAASGSRTNTVVVVMCFDPPGNGPVAANYATNVLPAGIGNLVLNDFYTRTQSDSRFLSSNAFGTYLHAVEGQAKAAAAARVADVASNLSHDYYTKARSDDRYVYLDAYVGLSNLLPQRYYDRTQVDGLVGDAKTAAACNLAALSNALGLREKRDSNAIAETRAALFETDSDLAALDVRQAAFSNYVVSSYYTRTAADATFATLAGVAAFSNAVASNIYTKDQSDARFSTLGDLAGFSKFVGSNYYDRAVSDTRFAKALALAELSNDLGVNYLPASVTNAKYAGAVQFAGLSNILFGDYVTSATANSTFTTQKTTAALYAEVHDRYYTSAVSDARFASSCNFVGLSNATAGALSNALTEHERAAASRFCNLEFDTAGLSNDGVGPVLLFGSNGSNLRVSLQSNISSGGVQYSSNMEVVRVDGNGYVGLGTQTPESRLHVIGTITATEGLSQTSDSNLKRDIVRIGDALAKVRELGGYTFFARDEPGLRRRAGVLAQEVMRVLPEAVNVSRDLDKFTYSVCYAELTALLIEAIKDLDESWREPGGREVESRHTVVCSSERVAACAGAGVGKAARVEMTIRPPVRIPAGSRCTLHFTPHIVAASIAIVDFVYDQQQLDHVRIALEKTGGWRTAFTLDVTWVLPAAAAARAGA